MSEPRSMMTRDEYRNGGARLIAKRGTELPHARLTPSDVLAIRRNVHGKTARQLAAEYNVHFRTIEKVKSFETWTHVYEKNA